MATDKVFLKGIIEGFYGRAWEQDTRLAYAGYLKQLGLNACLYAPKSDAVLRRHWRDRWDDQQWQQMGELAATYRQHGILWGVGLSPMELYLDYGATERTQLRHKVEYLLDLGMPLLGILFDDMPGDCADLALRQSEIINDISHWAPSTRLLVCPTYYSHDPVLEQYFGDKPTDYWRDLGRGLPAEADIFWTGNRVCSETISRPDIEHINAAFGRPVMLWDNYPVNDGAKRSNFLYIKPLTDRDEGLESLLTGHLCNPMNQALLSLPALSGLASLYGDTPAQDTLAAILGADTLRQLAADAPEFATHGLAGMGEARCAQLAACYATLSGQGAREAEQWLRGDYQFDPACLTD